MATTFPTTPLELLDDPEALTAFWQIYDRNFDRIADHLMKVLSNHAEFASLIDALPPDQMLEQRTAGRERLRAAVVDGHWSQYWNYLHDEGVTYARSGLGFSSWFAAVTAFREPFIEAALDELDITSDMFRRVVLASQAFTDTAMATLGSAYLDEKQRVIEEQQDALRELATPILSLRESLLILPLVGVVDSERARQITDDLLHAVTRDRARVVVVDITGVPAVDSMVANHLIQTTDAARMMGATIVVSGISTENAQTLVRIGVDPNRLNTIADLRGAIEWANQLLDT